MIVTIYIIIIVYFIIGALGFYMINPKKPPHEARHNRTKFVIYFLISSFIISIIALYIHRMEFDLKTFWLSLIIAASSTLVELFCGSGTDNLAIPVSVLLVLVLFL